MSRAPCQSTIRQEHSLGLGRGNELRPGSFGIDFNSRIKATIIRHLNIFPYPIEDSSFNEVYLDNTLECLDSVLGVMEEVSESPYRVAW